MKLKNTFYEIMNETHKTEYILKYGHNNRYNFMTKLRSIDKILKKFSEDNFYLLPYEMPENREDINDVHQLQCKLGQYGFTQYNTHEPKNYKLLTQLEVNKLLPTGCSLDKITHRILPKDIAKISGHIESENGKLLLTLDIDIIKI